MVKRLQDQGVIGAARLGGLRLAPHIYNSLDQLDRVIDILGRV